MTGRESRFGQTLGGEFLQEFLLVKPIFKGLSAVDKHHRDLVGELALKLVISFNVDLAPAKPAAPLELGKLLLHDLTKVATLARVHDNFAKQRHRAESSKEQASWLYKL